MTKADWKEAPHDAETYEVGPSGIARFCKGKYFLSLVGDGWVTKGHPDDWTILEHRPRIIAWEDMKEGMLVRCVMTGGLFYKEGGEYRVGVDKSDNFGPIDTCGNTTPSPESYTFELVSEPGQATPNPWDDFFDSPSDVSDDFMPEREQKWTHKHLGRKCNLVHESGFKAWVIFEDGTDKLVTTHGLKPIKPTITKAEAWDMLSSATQHIVTRDFDVK